MHQVKLALHLNMAYGTEPLIFIVESPLDSWAVLKLLGSIVFSFPIDDVINSIVTSFDHVSILQSVSSLSCNAA